jgi:hypothetical protein
MPDLLLRSLGFMQKITARVVHDPEQRLLLALVVSTIAHLWIFAQPGLLSSKFSTRSLGNLQVNLAHPVDKPPLPGELLATSSPPVEMPPVVLEAQKKDEKLTKKPAPQEMKVLPTPESVPAEKTVSQATKATQQAEASQGIPQAGGTGPAREVDIEFEITSGAEKKQIGSGQHRYVSSEGEYFGVSVSQKLDAEGGAPAGQWKLDISGRISMHGLSPILFQMQGAVPERLMAIKEVTEIVAPDPRKPRSGRMPDGILDRQSLLYQFMMRPPVSAGGKMWLTDGAKHGQYSYKVAGSESLRIGAQGEYRTVRVVITADEGSEMIELWLLPESHYLPAKVRHTDGLGLITEQVAISLRFK